jgi:hypothetical protein
MLGTHWRALLSYSSVNTRFLSTKCSSPVFSEQRRKVPRHSSLFPDSKLSGQLIGLPSSSPRFEFQLLQSGLLPGDRVLKCPYQNLLRMRGVRCIRLAVFYFDCQYKTLARKRSEIGRFNIDSAGTPDVCLFTITHFTRRPGCDPRISPTPPSSFVCFFRRGR